MEPRSEFVYLIQPYREQFIETMTEEESAVMSTHFEYLKQLLQSKKS